jgi:hypothetical protein
VPIERSGRRANRDKVVAMQRTPTEGLVANRNRPVPAHVAGERAGPDRPDQEETVAPADA